MSLQSQLVTLAAMVLSGNVLGLVFDSYRVVSREIRLSRRLIPLLDLIYWTAAAILVFRVLYATNLGELRAFVFLGLLLGISAYFALLSRWTVLAVRGVISLIRRLVRISIVLFHALIVRPLIFAYRCLRIIFGFLGALSIFLYKFMLQLLYPLWVVLRWASRPLRNAQLLRRWLPVITRWARRLAGAVLFWKRR